MNLGWMGTGFVPVDSGRTCEFRSRALHLHIEQGIEQTRQRFQALLLRLLRQRFGEAVGADVEQRIAAASVEEIETWSGRVVSAATLAEIFAG